MARVSYWTIEPKRLSLISDQTKALDGNYLVYKETVNMRISTGLDLIYHPIITT